MLGTMPRSRSAAVLVARVGATAVRVVHEAALRSARAEGLVEGGESEAAIVGRAHRPADHTAREKVDQQGQVRPSFVGRDVRHVGDPRRVCPRRDESADAARSARRPANGSSSPCDESVASAGRESRSRASDVDRILERGRLLRLDGPSVRTKRVPGDELVYDDQVDSLSSKISGTNAAEFPEPTRVQHSDKCCPAASLARFSASTFVPSRGWLATERSPRPGCARGGARSPGVCCKQRCCCAPRLHAPHKRSAATCLERVRPLGLDMRVAPSSSVGLLVEKCDRMPPQRNDAMLVGPLNRTFPVVLESAVFRAETSRSLVPGMVAIRGTANASR
jgi:hypothetical protein